MSNIKFGTGGWRAVIADGFTRENIRLLVAGLCRQMLEEGHEGKDGWITSPTH